MKHSVHKINLKKEMSFLLFFLLVTFSLLQAGPMEGAFGDGPEARP